MFHFATVAASFVALAVDALSDRAKRLTEGRLGAFDATAGAVDHLRRDFYLVELGPFLGNFFAKGVVVIDGGEPCFAFFAVESAAGDKWIHLKVLFFGFFNIPYFFTFRK